ncbi:MAG: hypothetical protein JNL74_20630 [Fibrobacteres bacterium]|nr:hypothetical protein [Fibrobacterota bacterium]
MIYRMLLLFTAAVFTFSSDNTIPSDPYSLLVDIPAFSDLFSQKGLSAYSAETRIAGPIRKSLDALAAEKGLQQPEFNELYDSKRGFAFKIRNSTYPPTLKRMIEEMFIPVLVFDRVISVMESKRELGWFQRFRSITTCDAKFVQYNNQPHIRLAFTAIADSSIEARTEGSAAAPVSVNTKSMTFILEPKNKLVKQLKIDQIEKGVNKEIRVEKKFLFEYKIVNGREFPSELIIEKDGKEEIRFRADYEQIKGFTVFDKKQFRYIGADGRTDTVNISYTKYSFNKDADLSQWESGNKGKDALTKEADADKLFQKARDAIMNGDSGKAKSLLKKIIKDYPQTAVAEQAATLLEGLP